MSMLAEVHAVPDLAPALPHLVGLQPAIQPGTLVLDDGEYTVGRGVMCDLVVPFGWVSRVHARLEMAGGHVELHDEGSSNGTFVNGTRLSGPHRLKDHDIIGFGEVRPHLTFVDPDTTCGAAERLEYDERIMRFAFNARVLELTPNQFRLLRALHQREGTVCTREQLAEAVWGASYAPGMEATTLDRLISTLRGVLRRAEAPADLLVTRPALGYVLNQ